MADYTIAITVDAADDAALLAALSWQYGKINDNGTLRERTTMELKAKLKENVIADLISIYKRHGKYLALQAEQNEADPLIS
jgi:hypothetical protein